ncbi:MAG: hypothetical protein ABFD98_03565 [Syntrophobacteraceae bacterium]
MSKSTEETKEKKVSRRGFLKSASKLVALPFALAIPSKTPEVVTGLEALRPFRDREEVFRGNLENKLAQIGVPRPPLPQQPTHIPAPVTYNTPFDTSQNTSAGTTTITGQNAAADDTNTDTHFDGYKTDYRTDTR